MHFDPHDPLHPSDGGLFSGPPRDGLLEQLRAGLKALEPICRPNPKLVSQRLLWFYQDEYRMANSVWQSRGLEGVVKEWGEDRTYASGPKVDISSTPPREDPLNCEEPVILHILDYEPNHNSKSLRNAKVRTATLYPSMEQRQQILESLSYSGLLQRVIPVVDLLTGAALQSSPIGRVSCGVEWNALQKGQHDETSLAITLEILPRGCSPEFFTLVIDGSGSVHCTIRAGDISEPGYDELGHEGHFNQTFELSSNELRTLLPTISLMAELPPAEDVPFLRGLWFGWTRKQF